MKKTSRLGFYRTTLYIVVQFATFLNYPHYPMTYQEVTMPINSILCKHFSTHAWCSQDLGSTFQLFVQTEASKDKL